MPRSRFRPVLLLLIAASGSAFPSLAQDWPPVELHTVTPCRAVDTRDSEDGPLRPGVARWFTLDGCGVPLTAWAVALNVTVTSTVGSVTLTAFPGDRNPETTSVVSAGPLAPTRAALAILPLATDGTGTLGFLGTFDSSSGQTHLILDVTGYFDTDDPGSSEDPGGTDSQTTLGEPDLAYDGDPGILDDPSLYPPDQVGREPSFGYVSAVPVDCRQYSGGTVTPLGIRASSPRYLAYAGAIKLLVGASADVACHFRYTKDNPMLDKCNFGPSLSHPPNPGEPVPGPGTHYEQVLTGLKNAGFNKTRLWVALGYETDRENLPFLWDAQGGYWRLDQKNQDYFDRIRAVVSKAKELDMFVEVTFFAPFQGPRNGFSAGPWSWNANLARALDPGQTGPPTRAGFTSQYYAVIHDTRTGVEATRNERMRHYQKKVIEWTVEELWCYDNVYWEIANEPEERKVYPLKVADWQKSMIATVRQEDCPATATDCTDRLSALARRHLIAVQPFTKLGADNFLSNANVSIINGHYTQIRTDPVRPFPDPQDSPNRLDLGAIELGRRYATQAKVLGFNEGKITPLGGTSGTRSHVNGIVAEGPDAARAEAWEFLFYRGGTLGCPSSR